MVGFPTLHVFLSPTAFIFLVFQKMLHCETENWHQRAEAEALLSLFYRHSNHSKLLLSKKPMQVKCSLWIIWVSVHHWPGVFIHSAGNRILYWIVCSAPLAMKRFALFSGLRQVITLGFLSALSFSCLQKRIRHEQHVSLWEVKH